MSRTKYLLTILSIISSLNSFAQAPKYSNEFLSIGVGGRAMGMSGSVAANVDDATAAYWNPAGLNYASGNIQIAAMHSELFAGISKFDYATLATHIDSNRTIGFSIIRFGTDEIPNTLDLIDPSGSFDYSRVKEFSAADYAFMFTYSAKTKVEGLNIGGNAKVIHRKVGEFGKAWGFGFDLAAQYRKDKWRFGAMAKDVTSTFNSWSFNTDLVESTFGRTGNEIPKNSTEITLPKLILGAGYLFNITPKITFLGELNTDITFDGQRNVVISSDPISIDPRIGLEVGYNNLVFLRGGIQNIQKVKEFDGTKSSIFQPNIGVGVKLGNVMIDYALTNIGSQETLYSNVFSLRLDINKRR